MSAGTMGSGAGVLVSNIARVRLSWWLVALGDRQLFGLWFALFTAEGFAPPGASRNFLLPRSFINVII